LKSYSTDTKKWMWEKTGSTIHNFVLENDGLDTVGPNLSRYKSS